MNDGQFIHGRSGYIKHRCLCDVCVDAHRTYQRNYGRQRRAEALADGRPFGKPRPVDDQPSEPPVIPIGPWHERAACKGKGWLFLVPSNRAQLNRGRLPERNHTAIAMCFDCPVLEQCEQWAFAHQVDPCSHHILAGLTPRQRNVKRRVLGYAMPGTPGDAA